jgi:antirestriction protein ArdC
MIILNERVRLMEEGKLRGTGQYIDIETADGTMTIELPEELHTYNLWKALGYQVRKGEKAITRLTIWKHSKPKVESIPMKDGENVEYLDKGKMFMKNACFFSASQVEPITA